MQGLGRHVRQVALVALVACKGRSIPDVTSCTTPSLGACRELAHAETAADLDQQEAICRETNDKIAPSTFAEAPCALANVKATCTTPAAKDFYYTSNAFPLDNIEAHCKQAGGTFGR